MELDATPVQRASHLQQLVAERRPGDWVRILSINGEAARELYRAVRALEGLAPGDIVSLRVEDPGGNRRSVSIRIPG